jgi:hypothetical protein
MSTEKGGFGKHYTSMYSGSMVGKGAVVFAVMGYVISTQVPGEDGEMRLEMNPELLGFILGEKAEAVDEAIRFLCGPDPKSRSREEGGRRLVKEGEFLYRVVNGAKYRAMGDPARRREQNRVAQARFRERVRLESKRERESRLLHESNERRFVRAVESGDEPRADAIVDRTEEA